MIHMVTERPLAILISLVKTVRTFLKIISRLSNLFLMFSKYFYTNGGKEQGWRIMQFKRIMSVNGITSLEESFSVPK